MKTTKKKSDKAVDRRKRQGEALRKNLVKRKQQAAARTQKKQTLK